MELRHIRHFLAVAKSGSLTDAAEVLGIAQPALSQSIARLEKSVGARLFARSRSGATLTPAGQAFLVGVEDSSTAIDVAADTARRIGSGLGERLTVSFVTHACFNLLDRALTLFVVERPDVEFVLQEASGDNQLDKLRQHSIDVTIGHPLGNPGRQLRSVLLYQEELVAAVPQAFQIRGDSISVEELASLPLIVFPEHRAPGARAAILSAFQRAGKPLHIRCEVTMAVTALCCVSGGMGVALLARSSQALSYKGVKYVPISEAALLPRVGLSAVLRANSQEKLAGDFVAMLQRVAQDRAK